MAIAVARTNSPSAQAYQILHIGYAALPIMAGADKFLHFLANWNQYLAPAVARMLPLPVGTFMMVVGAIEVAAGLLVAFAPRIGAYVVAAWLAGIIVNLLMIPAYLDVALRDFGLALGALALARIAEDYR